MFFKFPEVYKTIDFWELSGFENETFPRKNGVAIFNRGIHKKSRPF